MKKTILLTAIGMLLGAASLQAQTADIYITGSSAFRANVFNAVSNLYNPAPNINGGSGGVSSSSSRWTMSGQIPTLFGTRTINVHCSFNGSVQGVHGLYDNTDKSVFYANGTPGDTNLVTNTVSCAFSDVDSSSTAYALDPSSFYEKYCAVQPFVYVRSLNCPNTFTNITIQQLLTIMPNGQLPLSYLTGNPADASTPITLVNRSLDSGTRVSAYADALVSGSPAVYYWWTNGTPNYILTNVYLGPSLYSYGYVGGGDVKNVLIIPHVNNVAIGYLGLSDAKGVNGGANILSYNGAYPSSDIKTGSSVPAAPSFDAVRNGQYSYWAYEVLGWPKTVSAPDQNISSADLKLFCRTLSGYDSTLNNFVGGVGSLDYDISIQPTKVAVRLGDMNVSRQSVGGPIAP